MFQGWNFLFLPLPLGEGRGEGYCEQLFQSDKPVREGEQKTPGSLEPT